MCIWHFISANWEDPRQYYSDFPWDDYCFYVGDPSLCAEPITEVIKFGMELYIPHTFSYTKAKIPLFEFACSRAVNDREAYHKLYCSRLSAETHLNISDSNHAKFIPHLSKKLFHQ